MDTIKVYWKTKTQKWQPETLEQFIEQKWDPTVGFCFMRLGNREDAENATSTTFLRLCCYLQSTEQYSIEGKHLDNLRLMTARGICADAHRRRNKQRDVVELDEELIQGSSELNILNNIDNKALLADILAELEEVEVFILCLRALLGYSYKEIQQALADMYDMYLQEASIRVKYQRIVEAIRNRWKDVKSR